MASMKNVATVLATEIKDLYSAEKQLLKAIPKMTAGANSNSLKAGLTSHLEETKHQVERLEKIAELLEIKPTGKLCKGMVGIVSEAAEAMAETAPPEIYDIGIIAAARRVEHYEAAGYLTAIALAEGLGHKDVVALLKESLKEEEHADAAMKSLVPGLMSASEKSNGAAESTSPISSGRSMAKTA